jgi:hypothetical protein
VSTPDRPPEPDGQLSVLLHRCWRPDLAAVDRHDFEARALANRSYAPWLVFVGRSTVPDPPDLAGHLDRLRRLADRLCVADACYGLAERCLTAPAHYLDPRLPDPHPLPFEPVDVDQLGRRILRDCTDTPGVPGAQAIWRDGRWRHTSLRTADTTTTDGRSGPTRRSTSRHHHRWDAPPLTRLARSRPRPRSRPAGRRHNAGDPRLVQGLRWAVDAVGPQSPPPDVAGAPGHRSLPEAIAYCLRYPGSDLHRSLPTAPDRPIGVP